MTFTYLEIESLRAQARLSIRRRCDSAQHARLVLSLDSKDRTWCYVFAEPTYYMTDLCPIQARLLDLESRIA